MAHTTTVLEIDCLSSQWHIAILTHNYVKWCWAIHGNTSISCNVKVRVGKHGTLAPTYKGMKKGYYSTNNVECKFWPCLDDIKHYVKWQQEEVCVDWPMIPSTWLLKIAINLTREEVLVVDDGALQLYHREALSPHCRLSRIAILPIHWSHFHVLCNFQVWEDNSLQSSNTNDKSKKQIRNPRTHKWLLCGWSHCLSIYRLWSGNQHRL